MKSSVSNITQAAGRSSKPDPTEPIVCFTNIGPQQQRRRMTFGLIAFAVGIVVAAFLLLIDANVWWRVLLFLPFAAAASGYFQARDKT